MDGLTTVRYRDAAPGSISISYRCQSIDADLRGQCFLRRPMSSSLIIELALTCEGRDGVLRSVLVGCWYWCWRLLAGDAQRPDAWRWGGKAWQDSTPGGRNKLRLLRRLSRQGSLLLVRSQSSEPDGSWRLMAPRLIPGHGPAHCLSTQLTEPLAYCLQGIFIVSGRWSRIWPCALGSTTPRYTVSTEP